MNFNLLLFILFVLSGCGVKGDPISPRSNDLPSVLDNYPDIQTEKPLNDVKSR